MRFNRAWPRRGERSGPVILEMGNRSSISTLPVVIESRVGGFGLLLRRDRPLALGYLTGENFSDLRQRE